MRKPTIADARDLGEEKDCDMVIITYVKDGKMGYASYGRDEEKCDQARRVADHFLASVGVEKPTAPTEPSEDHA